MKKLLIKLAIFLYLSCIYSNYTFAQGKQANTWYFGFHAGLDFNQGIQPVPLTDGQTYFPDLGSGVATISNENGELLFYGDGCTIWNKNHVIMKNGSIMGSGSTQGAVIVPDPVSPNLYYYFNFVSDMAQNLHLQYSIIDMNGDNGKGEVLTDKKCIRLFNNTSSHLSAVMDIGTNSIWVVSHEFNSNRFLAFKVSSDSLHTVPVISSAGSIVDSHTGYMKMSPDGNMVAIAQYGGLSTLPVSFEILNFDVSSGIVDQSFFVHRDGSFFGLEFSPNNERFYALGDFLDFYQYNLKAGNAQQILDSEIGLTDVYLPSSALQLGPDGKIYLDGSNGYYIGVINEPNVLGLGCNYSDNAIYLNGGICVYGLPSFIQSYLNDPVFSINQHCSGQSTQFIIANLNGIDSVEWKFNDPGNAPNDTSSLFSPVYQFSIADTFYVELTVHSGFIEKTVMDTVVIYQTPTPQLPNDTTFCADETIDILLDAGAGQSYSWNNAWPNTNQTYQVTAPGTYWVRVLDHNCVGRDTINVIQYPEPLIDTTNISYSDASCGQSNGKIEGVQVSGTFSGINWKNNLGVTVATSPDLTAVEAGIYFLYVYYGDSCYVSPYEFEVKDLNAPIISDIIPTPDHCNLGMGKLEVFATGQGILEYSLDTTNFNPSNVISGLVAGEYYVTVKDVNGCKVMRAIEVSNIDGPKITDSLITLEHGYAGDGTITIAASGDSLYYVMEGGNSQSSGYFSGLSSGSYAIKVVDKWGCERWVYLTVERQPGILLSAWAGNDYKCREELAYSTITAGNFINVQQFKAVLKYNNAMLSCTGYHASAEFPVVSVTTNPGTVEVFWQSSIPKTLPGNVPLVDLIFTTQNWGVADIKWDSVYSEFTDGFGYRMADSLNPGVITINNPPLLENTSPKTEFCEGEQALIEFNYTGGTNPVNLAWQTPDNSTVQGLSYAIDSIKLTQAGTYTIIASDAINCKNTLRIPVTVYANPTAGFEAVDTIWFEHSAQLTATIGYSSYQWNTGDTSFFITVDKEGKYSVLMETTEGCTALSEVIMATTIVPIHVPTAFTPNGDGLNDNFRPVVDIELIKRYHLSIYNKWGQLLFETSNPSKGWDGSMAMEGVYVWVIDYENRVEKGFEIKGSVSLVK